MSYPINAIRRDFPVLSRKVHGNPLVYLDNGASAQKPQIVIDAITESYAHTYANVHRGLHYLSNISTEKYEATRGIVARFLGANEADILYTTGTTEAANLVSYSWATARIGAGDEIIVSELEHHANIVPWHFLRERQGAVLKWAPVSDEGVLDPGAVEALISPRTKLIAVTHMSNVLGSIVDVKAICRTARQHKVPVFVDGSQGAVHLPVNVQEIDCDFYAITGHKLYGPSGSGALYVAPARMGEMRPFMGGGDMIREVTQERVTYNDPPHKFEAGTPAIVSMIGLGVALDYLMNIGMEAIAAHEARLGTYASERLSALPWLKLQGTAPGKGAIFSFTMEGAHAHDISTVLDRYGIAVRAGTHCAKPLMHRMGVGATCRASFGMYNTLEEVDKLVDGLERCHMLFG